MSHAYVQVLLLAVAAAINPVPIAAAIVLLASKHGRIMAFFFLLSMIVVMAVVGGVMLAGGSGSQHSSGIAMAALQLVIGLAFLGLAVQQWRRKPDPPGYEPGWMKMIDRFGIAAPLVMGPALTNYALLSAAVGDILKADVGKSTQSSALALFIVVASAAVWVPLLLSIFAPRWATLQLERLRVWLAAHDRVLLMSVFGLMGAVFAVQGIVQIVTA